MAAEAESHASGGGVKAVRWLLEEAQDALTFQGLAAKAEANGFADGNAPALFEGLPGGEFGGFPGLVTGFVRAGGQLLGAASLFGEITFSGDLGFPKSVTVGREARAGGCLEEFEVSCCWRRRVACWRVRFVCGCGHSGPSAAAGGHGEGQPERVSKVAGVWGRVVKGVVVNKPAGRFRRDTNPDGAPGGLNGGSESQH